MTKWVNSAEAAAIMTRINGRAISQDYVRLLARQNKIKNKLDPQNESRRVFSAEDCEGYKVTRRTDQRVEVRVRDKRSGRPGGRPRKQQKEVEHLEKQVEHPVTPGIDETRELEQEIMQLRTRLDLERRYHQDHQVRGFKLWLKRQPGQTDFIRRVLADELVPPQGSRGTYEAYLRRQRYSEDEMAEFAHLWKAMLLQS